MCHLLVELVAWQLVCSSAKLHSVMPTFLCKNSAWLHSAAAADAADAANAAAVVAVAAAPAAAVATGFAVDPRVHIL